MNDGFEPERPHGFARAFGIACGAGFGLIGGFLLFLCAGAFATMLGDAMPRRSPGAAIAMDLALLRSPKATSSARALGLCGVVVVWGLMLGDLSGLVRVSPHHVHGFIAPAVP